jgi:hypothetical protein
MKELHQELTIPSHRSVSSRMTFNSLLVYFSHNFIPPRCQFHLQSMQFILSKRFSPRLIPRLSRFIVRPLAQCITRRVFHLVPSTYRRMDAFLCIFKWRCGLGGEEAEDLFPPWRIQLALVEASGLTYSLACKDTVVPFHRVVDLAETPAFQLRHLLNARYLHGLASCTHLDQLPEYFLVELKQALRL